MKDGRVFVFPSSGTGAWESAITNTLAVGDKVLMSRFGQFSLLWVDMAERLGLKVVLCDEEWGTGVPVEKYAEILAKDTAHEIKAVFATHNETATGVSSDIAGVRKALDDAKHPALLMVDGVSSVGSLDMRMGEWGVDCCVSGSQKGFMLPTGLGILAVSQKALDTNKSLNGRMNRCFFSWEDMIKTNDLGYFPYTPATQLIRACALRWTSCSQKASTTCSPVTRVSPPASAPLSMLGASRSAPRSPSGIRTRCLRSSFPRVSIAPTS